MNQPDNEFGLAESPGFMDRFLPAALSLAGICMTILSVMLLINAAKIGVFMRMLLGLIGVVFVDSLILAFVATRIALGMRGEVSAGEKAVLLILSLSMGIGLIVS